jgi:hypothetical protein
MERSVTQQSETSKAVTANPTPTPTPQQRASLVRTFAAKLGLGVDENKLMSTLKETAFKQPTKDGRTVEVTDAQMMALLIVANEYKLNPFLKEIYAFPTKGGGITPMVGYDGWIRLVQSQPTYKGEELESGYNSDPGKDGEPMGFYYECTMWRSDRDRPTKVREYYKENYRNTDPWNQMPNRMTRNRAYIQCARMCFGFGGIYDPDEAERIANAMAIDATATPVGKPATQAPRARQIAQEQTPQPSPQSQVETSADGKATSEQLEQIRYLCDQTGVAENETAEQFGVDILEDLSFEKVPEVLAWVDRVGKGG